MENRNSAEGSSQHNSPAAFVNKKWNAAPTGFDGMNFEQQRGSYKNSERGSYQIEHAGKSPEQAGDVS